MKKKVGVVSKKNKPKDGQKNVPLTWFVLIIILAVVLSFIISLVVLSLSGGQRYSVDSGRIVVQVQPDLGGQGGKIIVEVVDNKIDNKEVLNAS